MSQAVFGSPLKSVYGETKAITTTAGYVALRPGYHEVKLYCPSAWRMGLSPRLSRVKSGSAYTDYTAEALDRNDSTHVPLDGMTTAKYLYLGFTAPVRGWYINVDDTNKNDNAATLDVEYCYDVSTVGYYKVTGTVSAALTVGETVTGSVSGCTATHVYDDGSTYIIVKAVTTGSTLLKKGMFSIGENVAGASQACNTITAIDKVAVGTGYFTDVASDSDGTDVSGDTLKQDGLYSFTLPSVVQGMLAGVDSEPLYWYRFAPSATLSATVDLIDIIPASNDTNYAYMEAGVEYQFSLNVAQVGAFVVASTLGTPTMNITWLKH